MTDSLDPKDTWPVKIAFGTLALGAFLGWVFWEDRPAPKPAPAPGIYKPDVPVFVDGSWFITSPAGTLGMRLPIQPPVPADVKGAYYAALLAPPLPLYGTIVNNVGLYGQAIDSVAATNQALGGAPVRLTGAYAQGNAQGSSITWAQVTLMNTGLVGWVPLSSVTGTSSKNSQGSGL